VTLPDLPMSRKLNSPDNFLTLWDLQHCIVESRGVGHDFFGLGSCSDTILLPACAFEKKLLNKSGLSKAWALQHK
jgi:hypothetical protein